MFMAKLMLATMATPYTHVERNVNGCVKERDFGDPPRFSRIVLFPHRSAHFVPVACAHAACSHITALAPIPLSALDARLDTLRRERGEVQDEPFSRESAADPGTAAGT